MGPLQGLGQDWASLVWGPGMPREQCWAVPMSADGLRSAWAGPREQGSGRGSGVPIRAGWEAQAVPTAALESPAWLCQPPGSDRVKWRL